MLDLNGPLWKFAIKFYGLPDVAKACLQIQDEVGVDTVLLLLLLYADTVLDRALSAATIRSGRLVMEQWRGTTVLPIRNVRRALNRLLPACPTLRRRSCVTKSNESNYWPEQIQLAIAADWLAQQPVTLGLPLETALGVLFDCYGNPELADRATFDLFVQSAQQMRLPG